MSQATVEPVAYGALNLTFKAGTTYQRTFTWKDGDGNPIDLTDYNAHLQAVNGTTVEIDCVSTGTPDSNATATGSLTLGGTAGTIVLLIAASETAKLPVSVGTTARYAYDLTVTDPQSNELPLLAGVIAVEGAAV